MASVSFVPAAAAIEQPTATAPAWWRRAHSYSVPLVVATQIAATWLVIQLGRTPPLWSSPLHYEMMMAAVVGFVYGQSFLLGLWAALGGLATIPRWLIVGVVSAAGGLVAFSAFRAGWENILEAAPEAILSSGALMGLFAAILLPLRRLAGWRIDFDAAYHAPARRRGQLGLMDFAAMFLAVAFPLTLCRVLIETFDGEGAMVLLLVTLLSLFVLATAGPVARAILAARRPLVWLAAAALWVVGMAWGQSLLAQLVPDFNLVGSSFTFFGLEFGMLAFHVGIALAVAAPLFALRCCGLKLLVVGSR